MATIAGRRLSKIVSFSGSKLNKFQRYELISGPIIIGDGSGSTIGAFAERKYCFSDSFSHSKLRRQNLSVFANAHFVRHFCSFSDGRRLDLFPDESKVKAPNPFRLLKVFWNFYTFYRNYDRSFDSEEFGKGALKAMLYITNKLAKNEFESLEGLVVPETLGKVGKAVAFLSESIKELFVVEMDDVQLHFVDSVQYRKEASGKTYLDVMAVFYYMNRSKDFADRISKSVVSSPSEAQKYAFRVINVNIGFTKRISPELDHDWVINKLNYFHMLSDDGTLQR